MVLLLNIKCFFEEICYHTLKNIFFINTTALSVHFVSFLKKQRDSTMSYMSYKYLPFKYTFSPLTSTVHMVRYQTNTVFEWVLKKTGNCRGGHKQICQTNKDICPLITYRYMIDNTQIKKLLCIMLTSQETVHVHIALFAAIQHEMSFPFSTQGKSLERYAVSVIKLS